MRHLLKLVKFLVLPVILLLINYLQSQGIHQQCLIWPLKWEKYQVSHTWCFSEIFFGNPVVSVLELETKKPKAL